LYREPETTWCNCCTGGYQSHVPIKRGATLAPKETKRLVHRVDTGGLRRCRVRSHASPEICYDGRELVGIAGRLGEHPPWRDQDQGNRHPELVHGRLAGRNPKDG
jgi:hypothetical protein